MGENTQDELCAELRRENSILKETLSSQHRCMTLMQDVVRYFLEKES